MMIDPAPDVEIPWIKVSFGVLAVACVIAFVVSLSDALRERAALTSIKQVQEMRSADNQVACYKDPAAPAGMMFCMPTWLLARPGNWIIAYPKTGNEKP